MRKIFDMNTDTTIFLIHTLLIILMLFAVFPAQPIALAESRGPLITILAPKDGETVKPTFDLFYQLRAGLSEDSVDIFLDGLYQRHIKHTFSDVPPGRHEIRVKVSTHEPELLIDWDHIDIEVK